MAYLYLFTSNYGEYYKDVLDILSLPNKFVYRFRYDLKHLSPTFRDLEDFSIFKNMKGIVILTNKDKKEVKHDYIPLREISITDISHFEESFIYFEFELENYPSINEEELSKFSDFINKRITKDTYIEKLEDKYSFLNNYNQYENWNHIVDCIENIEKFDRCIFTKVYNLYNYKDKSSVNIQNHRYQLRGGNSYKIEFMHRYSNKMFNDIKDEKKDFYSKLNYLSDIISPVVLQKSIRGRYDLNSHSFYCLRNMNNVDSLLAFSSNFNNDIYFPNIEIPIEIKKSWTRDNLLLLLMGIGLIIGGISDILIKGLNTAKTQSLSINNFYDFLEVIYLGWSQTGVLAPVLTILGLILTFINRYPKK